MNINDLRAAQIKFNALMPEILKGREEDYQLRRDFANHFTINHIKTMDITEYALGYPLSEDDWSFCYQLEQELDGLGRIIGATAFKFGVYYGKTKSDPKVKFRHTSIFGDNVDEAYENVITSIISLLKAGKKEDIKAIVANPISNMFKGKILSTYYPKRYLNIFSERHLKYFLTALDMDSPELFKQDVVYLREALLDFKNNDEVMRSWSVDMFGYFLYRVYPLGPNYKNENDEQPEFPPNAILTEVDLDFADIPGEEPNSQRGRRGNKGKPNYEKQARKLKVLGDRGEKLVLDFEKRRLRQGGYPELAKKVDRVSLKSDSYGYDILSYNTDGTKRYIEVKATTREEGLTELFITANELKFATGEHKGSYRVYIVYDVKSKRPRVWDAGNLFSPESRQINKLPVVYKVKLNTGKA